jgi:hypothetical protein
LSYLITGLTSADIKIINIYKIGLYDSIEFQFVVIFNCVIDMDILVEGFPMQEIKSTQDIVLFDENDIPSYHILKYSLCVVPIFTFYNLIFHAIG